MSLPIGDASNTYYRWKHIWLFVLGNSSHHLLKIIRIIYWKADPTEACGCIPFPVLYIQEQHNNAFYRGTAYIPTNRSFKGCKIFCGSQCFLLEEEEEKRRMLQSAGIMNSQLTNLLLPPQMVSKLFLNKHTLTRLRFIALCEHSRQIATQQFVFKQNYSVSSLNLALCHYLKIRITYFCCLVTCSFLCISPLSTPPQLFLSQECSQFRL